MADPIDVQVVSPEAALFQGDATEVYARSLEGEIGILPGHQPVLLFLAPAPLRVRTTGGTDRVFAVRSGFLEYSEGRLTVLADDAQEVGSVDEARALLERDAASS